SVRNSSGLFVHANLDSVAEAARESAGTTAPGSITNPSRKGAYPIATYTWLVLPQQIADPAKRAALLAVLQWILNDGQKECSALAYTPLPKEIADKQAEFVRDLMKMGAMEAKQH